MASAKEFIALVNCTIRFVTPEGEYEGLVKNVFPADGPTTVAIGKCILLPNIRLGSLKFGFQEVSNIRVISRPDGVKETSVKEKDVSPVYPETEIERLFHFDAGSDIEDGESEDSQPTVYKMKHDPRLSKVVPNDYQIIDSYSRDFCLAIRHIKRQEEVGVSLEGIKVSRSGTLTWLAISTKSCNFIFDILALKRRAFQQGLKYILEDGRIQKIFHDSRLASDCLFHQYGVCLSNVFDTQVADYLVTMQMNTKDQISNRVNTLDACLHYYLGVPCEYLYGEANLDNKEDSPNFHALRPLRHDIQDVLIKNVIYLPLLKRELEGALMIPLRRATGVYLNCVQKLTEQELLVVPHQPGELPLDMHLDGIQIFRHKDFEYACSTVGSGSPYPEINNPLKNYLSYNAQIKNGQTEDKQSVVNKAWSEDAKVTFSKLKCKTSVNYQEASKSSHWKKALVCNYFDRSSQSDLDCSDDSKKMPKYKCNPTLSPENEIDVFDSYKRILKSASSQSRGSSIVQHSLKGGATKFSSRTSEVNIEKVKPTYDKPSKDFSPITSENTKVDVKATVRQSFRNDLPGVKLHGNPPVSYNMSTPEIQSKLSRPTTGKKSAYDVLRDLNAIQNSFLYAAHTCDENLATDSMAISKSVFKESSNLSKETGIVKSVTSEELVNGSNPKRPFALSDAEMEVIAARVKARGALLRNRKTECSASDNLSTCDSLRSAQIKPKETAAISSGDVEARSEDVTLYYRDALDKPSKVALKINSKSSCLAVLYREAGDHSMRLWNGDNPESVPTSSPNKPDDQSSNGNILSKIRSEFPSRPIDEKLRLRLIPSYA